MAHVPSGKRFQQADDAVRDQMAGLLDDLRAARRDRALTQRELGAMLNVTEPVVQRWEHAREQPYLGHLIQWAALLGRRVDVVNRRLENVQGSAADAAPGRSESEHFHRLAGSLRQARLSAGLSQKALAAELNVSSWTVSMWESAQRQPRILNLLVWARVLDCGIVLTHPGGQVGKTR